MARRPKYEPTASSAPAAPKETYAGTRDGGVRGRGGAAEGALVASGGASESLISTGSSMPPPTTTVELKGVYPSRRPSTRCCPGATRRRATGASTCLPSISTVTPAGERDSSRVLNSLDSRSMVPRIEAACSPVSSEANAVRISW